MLILICDYEVNMNTLNYQIDSNGLDNKNINICLEKD